MVFQNLHRAGVDLFHAAVVLFRGKIVLKVVIQHRVQHAAGKNIGQPHARLGVVILRADGKQNQETVIRFLVTDAPLVKEVIRIIGNVLAVGKIHGRHHDLRAAGFGKCAARALNIAFRRGRKHIRAVIHIARRGIRQRHGKRRHRHKYEHQHRKQHSARLFQNRMYGLCHKHFLSLSVSNFYANSSTSPMPTSFASAYAGELCSASLNAAALSL